MNTLAHRSAAITMPSAYLPNPYLPAPRLGFHPLTPPTSHILLTTYSNFSNMDMTFIDER